MIRRFWPDLEVMQVWLRARWGYSGVGLLMIVHGASYLPVVPLPAELPAGLELVTQSIPLFVWGLPWVVAGLLCVTSSLLDLRPPWLALSAAIGSAICLGWSLAYVAGWLISGGRGYVSTIIYTASAVSLLLVADSLRILRPMVRIAPLGDGAR